MTIDEVREALDAAIYELEHFKPYGGAYLPCNKKSLYILEKRVEDLKRQMSDLVWAEWEATQMKGA